MIYQHLQKTALDQAGETDLHWPLDGHYDLLDHDELKALDECEGAIKKVDGIMNSIQVRLMVGLAPVTAAALHPASPLHPLATFSQGVSSTRQNLS